MGPCYIFRRWNIIFYLCRGASARACICQNVPFSAPNSARHRKNIHHFWFCNLMWVHVSLAEYFSVVRFRPCILPHLQCTACTAERELQTTKQPNDVLSIHRIRRWRHTQKTADNLISSRECSDWFWFCHWWQHRQHQSQLNKAHVDIACCQSVFICEL